MTIEAEAQPRPATTLGGLLLLTLVAAVVLGGVGYWPTRVLAGPAGVSAQLVGLGIALVAALAGLVPGVLTAGGSPRVRLAGVLTAGAIRFILTLAGLLAALLGGPWPRLPLGLWTAIGYAVLLAVDTAGLVWLNRRRSRVAW